MKNMKKIFALLIAMVMVLGMSTSVFAASITITHDEDTYDANTDSAARVYQAYKIFDAVYDELAGENTQDDKDAFSYDPDDAAVAYTMATDSPWVDVMTDDEQTWFDVKLSADGSVYVVTAKDSYATSADAKDFAEYLQENMPDDAASTEVTVDGAAAEVDPGYYLIVAKDTKDGVTRLALVTTDVEMVEKNTYITVGKTTARTSYSVGDLIEYTVTVNIPDDTALTQTDDNGDYVAGHGPIILHDILDSRLTFQGEMKTASIGDDEYELVWTEDTAAANHTTNQDDGCTFELIIPVTEDLLGETVTFTYEAEVNSTAATDTGLVNELGGEINGYKTVPDEPEVYTFDFDFVKKFDGSEEELTATFELRTDADDEDTAISFIKDTDGNYIKADSDDEDAETTITMTNGEQLNFLGFEAGTYYLVELTTSTGYNLLDGPVTVTIEDTSTESAISHEVTYVINGEESAEGVVTVTNYSGTVLPSTGGIGTTIFYILGAILVIGAGVVLVSRRRMSVR